MSCYTHSPIGLTRTFVPALLFHLHFSFDFYNGDLTLLNQYFHSAPVFQQTFHLLHHFLRYYRSHRHFPPVSFFAVAQTTLVPFAPVPLHIQHLMCMQGQNLQTTHNAQKQDVDGFCYFSASDQAPVPFEECFRSSFV